MTDTKEIVPLIYDTMFKAVFIRNQDILFKMIKDIFGINEKKEMVTMIGFETVESPYKKSYRGDIVVKLSDYSYVSIEMNNHSRNSILNRNLIQLIRIHNQIMPAGIEDKKLKEYRMRALNFNYMFRRDNRPIEMHAFCNLETNKISSLIYTICNINIEKCHEMVYNVDVKELPKAVRWGAILIEDNLENISHILGDDLLTMEEKEKFIYTIRELREDEKVLKGRIVEDNQRWREEEAMDAAREEGLEQGHEEGFEQGIEQNQRDIIVNLLKEKADYNFIARITGKTIDDIKTIEKGM